MKNFNTFLFMLLTFHSYGQLTGNVEYEEEGIAFEIPRNWVGQEMEEAFLIASSKEAGIVALTFHSAKEVGTLVQNMQDGVNEGGVNLRPSGAVKKLSDTKVECRYEGIVDNQNAKGIAIGLINPYGQGVVLFAMIDPERYGNRILELGRQVGNSIQFSKPIRIGGKAKDGLTAAQVTKDLKGLKLTYMDSYYSNTSGGGGYQRQKEINLCPNGLFTFYGGSYLNFPDPNYDPYQKNARGHGTWEFLEDAGKVLLQLNYNDGEYESFHVTYKDGKTFLNGGRYYGAEDAACY